MPLAIHPQIMARYKEAAAALGGLTSASVQFRAQHSTDGTDP